jgi:hypothetical protein
VCAVPHILAVAVSHHASSNGGDDTSLIPLDIVLVLIGVVIGRLWGRRAGLKHLGASEFKSRWGSVRRISKW